jgi:hypothetical protein
VQDHARNKTKMIVLRNIDIGVIDEIKLSANVNNNNLALA